MELGVGNYGESLWLVIKFSSRAYILETGDWKLETGKSRLYICFKRIYIKDKQDQ